MPTSQMKATAIRHVVLDQLDPQAGCDRDPRRGELGDELRHGAEMGDVVDEPCDEEDETAGEDPGELQAGVDRSRRHRDEHTGEEARDDADPTERGSRAVVPALPGGDGHETLAERRGAQQGPEDGGRDGQRDQRDGCTHGA